MTMLEKPQEYRIMIQGTPNPNALKFVVNVPVKTAGNATYRSAAECEKNPMAKALFWINNITEVYFFDNYITVTQNGNADWDILEEKIKITILENLPQHNADFEGNEPIKKARPELTDPELQKIDAIIGQTVRPYLQMDGGDIQVVSLENNTLKVLYQGACGSCPSSAIGTLKSIENILQEQYHPDIKVTMSMGEL